MILAGRKRSGMYHSRNGFLTKFGLEEAAQRGVDRAHELACMGIDLETSQLYLDKVGSVSGLFEFELSDKLLDEQYRRFHSGS